MARKLWPAFLLSLAAMYTPVLAQSGIYKSTYGILRLVTETGPEYPGGGIVYGDYGDKGTVYGNFILNKRALTGYFHNGTAGGRFTFVSHDPGDFSNVRNFSGTYGYGESDNADTRDNSFFWQGEKTGNEVPENIRTAVWSGKWQTTFGDIILYQKGNTITGKYRDKDKIEATFNPATGILKGTFTNDTRSGHLEFRFEGNTFSGRWGWTGQMNEGKWDGSKSVKSNASGETVSTTRPSPDGAKVNGQVKYRIRLVRLKDAEDLYGFFGFQVFRQTTGRSEEIRSIGNKPADIFNTTEQAAFRRGNMNFPNTPVNYRDFIITSADLEDRGVTVELKYYMHLKKRITFKANGNLGYVTSAIELQKVPLDKEVSFGYPNHPFTIIVEKI